MSDEILTNWTIYYSGDTGGDKQIKWTGTTGTNTVNELYSELMHFFNDSVQNDSDDTTPMRAVTPTEYQIGAFDTGDLEPWFIDAESIKHLTGGAIETAKWNRITGSDTGIVKITYTLDVGTNGTDFVAGDIGKPIIHSGGSEGELLDFTAPGPSDTPPGEAWIRPTDNTSTHDWSTTGTDVISITGGSGANIDQTTVSTTGEMIWSNIFTLGTIASNTRMLVAQDNAEFSNSEDSGSGPWWTDGQIDILILTTDQDSLIDEGFISVYARQLTQTYSHFIVDASAGGRNPIPLGTVNDSNNASGNRQMVLSGGTGSFIVGERIVDDSDSEIAGVVDFVSGAAGSQTVQYHLVAEVTTDFSAGTGQFTGDDSAAFANAVNPTDVNPATSPSTGITVTFGHSTETFDTSSGVDGGTEVITTDTTHPFNTGDAVIYSDQGGAVNVGLTDLTKYYVRNLTSTTISIHTTHADAKTDTSRVDLTAGASETHLFKRNFSIEVDCNGQALSLVHERMKYITRRGETATLTGIEGQQYIGIDYRIDYSAIAGTPFVEGIIIQQLNTLASAIVVTHNQEGDYIMIRDTKGTFNASDTIEEVGTPANNITTSAVEVVSPFVAQAFGSFSGGFMTGARGVTFDNQAGADSLNISLTDDAGETITPPAVRNFELTGLQSDSEIRIYNLSTGAEIDGTESSGVTFNHQFTYTSDTAVFIIILHINYNWLRINGQSLLDQDQSIPVFQIFDRDYKNP